MSFNYVPTNTGQTVAFHQPGTTLTLGSPQGQPSQGPQTPVAAGQCQQMTTSLGGPVAGMPVTYVQIPATNLNSANNVGILNAGQPMIFQMASAQPHQTFLTAGPTASGAGTPTTAVLQPSYTLSAPNTQFLNLNNGTVFVQPSQQFATAAPGQEVQQTAALQAQATITSGKVNGTEHDNVSQQQVTQQAGQEFQRTQATYLDPSQGMISQQSNVPTPLNSTPQNPLIYMFEVDTDMDTIKATLPQIPSGDKWIRGITGPNFTITGLELYDPEEDEKPKYVNPKQFQRILKRRAEREKLIRDGRIPEERAKYLHESRHQHALNRTRLKDGRFFSKGT